MTTSLQKMTRSGAVRVTALTRVACVVFGLGAIALGMIGLPNRDRPTSAGIPPGMPGDSDPVAGARPDGGEITPAGRSPIDPDAVAARLAMLGNAPIIQVVEQPIIETTPPDKPEPPTAIASLADRVRYLGMVSSGDRRAAFLSIDGNQRIIREGAEVSLQNATANTGPLVVDRIGPGAVTLRSGPDRTDIGLAERSGASITMVAGGAVERLDTAASNDQQKLEGARQLTAQEERRLRALERGRQDSNPPNMAQIEAARSRLEARRSQTRSIQAEVDAATGQDGQAASDIGSEQPGRGRRRGDD